MVLYTTDEKVMLPQMSCYSSVSLLFVLLCLTWKEIRKMPCDNTFEVVKAFVFSCGVVFGVFWQNAVESVTVTNDAFVYVCLDRNRKSGNVHTKMLMAKTGQVMWRKFRSSASIRSKYHNRNKHDAYVTCADEIFGATRVLAWWNAMWISNITLHDINQSHSP